MSESIVIILTDLKYIQAAEILKILLFYVFIVAISTPIKLIMYALDKEKLLLMMILPLPIIKIVLNITFFESMGLNGIAYSTVIIYMIYLLSLIIFNEKRLRRVLIWHD